QDDLRAVWQVTNFDIAVSGLGNDRFLNARASLTLRNAGLGPGSTVSFRINPKAEIKAASVNGANASFRIAPERNLSRPTVTLPSPVAPDGSVTVTLDYRLPVEENGGLAAISPAGSQFLPLSFWYPSPNTIFAVRGADYAPFRLTVNGENVVSSGVEKSPGVFEQRLNGQPFFLTGNWETIAGTAEARGVNALIAKGASADERKQALALILLAANARAFYAQLLGAAPDTPVRLISATRGAGFNDAGVMVLDVGAFRRSKIDSATALFVAESIARLWIGAAAPVRGEGNGVLREGLTRFLATSFLEKQFATQTAEAERERQRLAYAAVAKRDAPLSRTTPLDDTYFNSVANKGAMVFRLAEHVLGRDAFVEVVRALWQSARSDPNGLTLTATRAALAARGGATLKSLLDQELDQPTDLDLMIGIPQQRGGDWAIALRNLGSVDAVVPVAAITDRGERLTTETTIPSRNFAEAVFKTTSRVVRAEVDPEKFYPQVDFANDIAPRPNLSANPLADAARLFDAQQYARAETTAQEILGLAPRMQEARILLARAQLAQNKINDAEKEFRLALEDPLPMPATLAWANIGLAEISMRRGQAAEAAQRFNDAVRADAVYGSTLVAREGRIRAEAAAKAAPAVDESARGFIAQVDQAIKSGKRAEIEALTVPGELVRFTRGVIGTQPEIWQTTVRRTEQLDANRLAADVTISARELGKDRAGTAVLILVRVGSSWKLSSIEFFEVK
ncbi:MAG: tetratricopeptide repeat protein, partial [Pyrinomonadaceae bacterium]